MKVCRNCKEEKSLALFRVYREKVINTCKKCESIRSAEWKKANVDKEKISREKSKVTQAANFKVRYNSDPEFKAKKLAEARLRYTKNWLKKLIAGAKNRSQIAGLPFNISEEDLVVPEFCPVLGLKLEISKGQPSDNSPSIDKIIPALGYTKGNVRVISYLANRMKSNASPEQLIMFAKWVLNEA